MRHSLVPIGIVVFVVACASSTVGRSTSDETTLSPAAIEQKLQESASEVIAEYDATMEPEVGNELRTLWSTAARRLVDDGASQEQVARAVRDARRIVTAAIARSRPTPSGSRDLTLENVESARIAVCPLYPFCD